MDAVAISQQNSRWPFILEGAALTLFGLAAIAWPGMTLYYFTVIFALFALLAGITNVIGGILRIATGWTAIGRIVVGGLLIAAGSYVFNHPGITALTLVLFVGFTILFRGLFEIVEAIANDEPHKVLAIVSGILGLIVGLVLLRYPVGGGLAYVWVVGIWALVSGPIMIAVGLGAGGGNRPNAA
jgi:uncharacterized membrane protein HdeD (DUF308 family)